MDLYLIRHGDAAPRTAPGVQGDADRPLTEEGKSEMKKIAAGLAKVADRPEIILTSPLLRAHQTAEIIRRAFDSAQSTLRD